MELKRAGIDLAKNVFQVHGVDEAEKPVLRKTLRRKQVLEFFAQRPPLLIGMEACGGAHYWARELTKLGHTVKLIAPQFVKPYVKSGKNDANDAEAICEAVSRPTMRFVEVKSAEQQAVQALHRVRARVVRARTALINEIRGLVAEYGLTIAKLGGSAVRRALPEMLEDAENGLPAGFRQLLDTLREELEAHDARLEHLNRQLDQEARSDERVQRLMAVEGVGVVTATAIVAAVGDARQFKSGRDFSAWLGIVPNQHSSGGKARLGGISKRGDRYLRTLLIHGARSVVKSTKDKADRRSEWIRTLAERRNKNIATVAVANKQARIIWALLARGDTYRRAA